MKTKWDILVTKEEGRLQTKLARLADLRKAIGVTVNNKETIESRILYYGDRLKDGSSFRVDDWQLEKRFLSDLEDIRSRCEDQERSLRSEESRLLEAISKTREDIRKFEWLRADAQKKHSHKLERLESELVDEWVINSAEK